MLKLTKKEKEKLDNKVEVVINGKKYFCKSMCYGLTELLVERLAKIVNINTAHYELVNVSNQYFYLSEEIKGNGIFLTASQIGIHRNSLYYIWNFFEKCYPNQVHEIMVEIVKIYLFDILMLNADRVSSNWGFIVNNERIESVYIFDNELAFCVDSPVMLTAKKNYNDKLEKYSKLDNWHSLFTAVQKNIRELEMFLVMAPEEYIDIFLDMYAKLTVPVVRDTYEAILKEVGNNKTLFGNLEYLRIYNDSYKAIGKLLEAHGLIGGSRKLVK